MIMIQEKITLNGIGFKSFTLALTLAFFLTGCGAGLSREKARKIIIEHYRYPLSATREITLNTPCYFMGWYPGLYSLSSLSREHCEGITDNKDWSIALKSKGLVTLEPYAGKDGSRGVVASLSKEGMKYAIGAGLIRMADEEFLDVTGIKFSGDNKQAGVEYTWRYINQTPFAKGTKFDDTTTHKAKVTLTLYDDGWRVSDRAEIEYEPQSGMS